MQLIVTLLLSGVVAAIVTAVLNISIQMRTLRISRLEESCECLYRMSDQNNNVYWKRRAYTEFYGLKAHDEAHGALDQAKALETEFERLSARALTIVAIVDIKRMPLRQFFLSCSTIVKMAHDEESSVQDDLTERFHELSIARDQNLEEIVTIAKNRIKALQNPLRLFDSL